MDAIRVNGFALDVVTDKGNVEKIVHKGGNYYSMGSDTAYKIRLVNNLGVRADAQLLINNEKVGTWRINPYSRVTVSKPNFVIKSNDLIKVVFRPEKYRSFDDSDSATNPADEIATMLADSTLRRRECIYYTDTVTPHPKNKRWCAHSAKGYLKHYVNNANPVSPDASGRFMRVPPLNEIDNSQVTTIQTRLIVDNDQGGYVSDRAGLRHANNSSLAPPPLDLHPSRPHNYTVDSRFTLSRKYYFDNI